MKRFKILLLSLIALIAFSCKDVNDTITTPELSNESLFLAIDQFNEAFQKGYVSVLDSMITQNYIHTNGSSKPIKKQAWLNYLRKRNHQIKSGHLEIINYKMEDIHVELHRNAAIVTGRIRVLSKKDGITNENEYRITNVWIKKSGHWKRAAFHDAKIK